MFIAMTADTTCSSRFPANYAAFAHHVIRSAHWNLRCITDGAFTPDGEFIPLPEMAVEPFLKLWENGVFKLLLKHGKITPETVADMNSWKHSGFSVHKNVRIEANDNVGLEGLTQYIARCPFSLDRIMKLTETDHVVYKAEHPECRRFPELGDDRLKVGVSRNFQVFDPLDFIAEITQHIPNHGEHTIHYFGFYSNKVELNRLRRDFYSLEKTQKSQNG